MTEISGLSTTDDSNATITGANIAEGNLPSTINNAIRNLAGMVARWTDFGTIASASTCNIGAEPEEYLEVTGTTTITAFDTVRNGTRRVLKFAGALTLTHNATSLILPGGANVVTAAGDVAIMVSEGSGNWRCVNYSRASGAPLALRGFSSANYNITAAGSLTIAHGLGVAPRMVQAILVCQTDELGYTAGDVVYVNPNANTFTAVSAGVSIVPDATNLNVRFGADTNTFRIIHKATGAGVAITNSNWNFAVRALAF